MVHQHIDFSGQSKACLEFVSLIKSDRFRAIRENYEEKFNKYDHKQHLKKDEHLKSLLSQAEEKMKSGEHKMCSKLYNEALLQVNHPLFVLNETDRSTFCSVLLGRAMAFYELEYYDEFLLDCDALMNYCTNELTDEQRKDLEAKRNFCKSKLDEAMKNLESDLKVNLSKMKSNYVENKNLYGVSEKIGFNYHPITGRGLQANERLDENELISVQKAFAAVLSPNLYLKNCYNCLMKLSKFGGFFPCRQCKQIRFCSYQCEEECWSYHQYECSYLDLLNYSNSFHFQPKLALQLVLREGIDNVLNSIGRDRRMTKETDHQLKKKNRKKNSNKTIHSTQPQQSSKVDFSTMNYEAILSLQDHAEKCPDFSPPITMMLLFLVQKFKDLSEDQVAGLGCVLLKHLQQIHTNSKYVLSKELKAEANNKHTDLLLISDVKIGCALFQTFSLINHDCAPNVISFHFIGSQIYLKTLREIQPGEQITISYGVNRNWHTYSARQDFLSKFYFFDCECKSCTMFEQPVCHALKCEKCVDAPVFPIKKHPKYDSKCSKCQTMFANKFEIVKKETSSSVDLLEKVNLLFSKGDETDFSKVKIILNDIKLKFEKVFYKYNQKLNLVEQQLSLCCKLLNENEESVRHQENAAEILSHELNEHYSGSFNSLVKLIDRQVILFRACSDDPKNLDHLKLDYLRNLKKAKLWIDINLRPTSDEYMYFLSFLSLSFSSYTNLGKEIINDLKVS